MRKRRGVNVILIEADQLSARWLGCYGNPAAHTPHLDRLAARGCRFDHCLVNNPVCMASRASTITGRSPQHHGVYYNGWELGLDLPTFPQVLQEAGMQTLGVGKYHLECHGRSAYNDVLKYGFDRAEVTEDIRAGDWLDWVERTHPDCYEQALATVWEMPHLGSYGPSGRDLNPAIRQAKEKHPPDTRAVLTYPSVVPEKACQTRWVMERALAFMAERDPGRPFFLKGSFVDPHDPYDPPERFLDLIDRDCIAPPVRSEDEALKKVLERFGVVEFLELFARADAEEWRTIRHHYFASIAFIDEQVGRLCAFLEEQGLEEETAIIFTADHGDTMGDHGFPVKGAWHFDACIRVPLLITGPGVASGRVEEQVVSNLDLFPTILALAGVASQVPVEGMDLGPLLADTGRLDRPDAALTESYSSYANMAPALRAWTVATPESRYTRFGDGAGMLFDLAEDPDEQVNLCGRPEAAALEARMKEALLDVQTSRYLPLSRRRKHPSALH